MIASHLKPIQEEYHRLTADKAYVESCIRQGAEKALTISSRTLEKAYKKVGFYQINK